MMRSIQICSLFYNIHDDYNLTLGNGWNSEILKVSPTDLSPFPHIQNLLTIGIEKFYSHLLKVMIFDPFLSEILYRLLIVFTESYGIMI